MSKLRYLNESHSKSRLRMLLEQRGKRDLLRQPKSKQSMHLREIRCHTQQMTGQQQAKDRIYNKNYVNFREVMEQRNTQILPFLSSLRSISDYRKQKAIERTALQPFEVAAKQTMNQKIKKNTNDMTANQFRLSKINYRWNGNSGLNTKSGCEFECGLRLDEGKPNSTLYNIIEPLRFKTVQKKSYKLKQLICQRQKRLFTIDQ